MKLIKLHSYNVIRALRVILPLVVIGLCVIGLSNYWSRRPTESEPESRRLVGNVSELSENVQFSRTEGGRRVFTVDADQNVGTEDGRSLLEGVRIHIFGQDISSPDRLISSPYCDVEASTGDISSISCTGEAEIQFDDRTTIETTSLIYVHSDRVVRTREAARVIRPGEFEADADELLLDLDREIVSLTGGVVIMAADGTRLDTEFVRYFQQEDRAQVSGGLRLRTEQGELRGRDAEIRMAEGTLSPRFVRLTGRVTAFSVDDAEPVSIDADSLEVFLDSDRIQSVIARGMANAGTGLGRDRQTLSGDLLEGFFTSTGVLDAVEARGHALMVASTGEELEAETIRRQVTDSSLFTTGPSRLETRDVSVDGADFRISGNDLIDFETDRRATIRNASTLLEADRTRAVIAAADGGILELIQNGDARFERNARSGTADEIVFDGENQVALTGNARVRDTELLMEARRIELDMAGEQFRASEDVQAVFHDEQGRVIVVGDEAEGGGDRVRVGGDAQLWRDNVHVAADVIDILPDARAFSAAGGVRSIVDRYHVQSDRLDFDDREGTVDYTGRVRARSDEVDFDAERVQVFLEPPDAVPVGPPAAIGSGTSDRIIRIVATGSVELHSGGRTGWGDEAVYVRESRTVTLRGSDAELMDPETGSARGPEFVWNVDKQRVVMTGEEGRPAVSRRPLEGQR